MAYESGFNRSHQVGSNIIAMYPSTSLFIAFGQLAIVILVLFSYPLQVHPCRNCLDKVFHPDHISHDGVAKPATSSVNDESDEDGDDGAEDDHAHAEMSTLKHSVLTTGIIVSGFIIAYFVDDLRLGKLIWGDSYLLCRALMWR